MLAAARKGLGEMVLILAVLFLITLIAPLPYFLMAEQNNGTVPENKPEKYEGIDGRGVLEDDLPGNNEEGQEENNDLLTENEEVVNEPALTFTYPDAVRGVYVTGNTVGVQRFNNLLELVDNTDLNAMVIDIKDDWGYITYKLKGTEYDEASKNYIKDAEALLKTLAEHNIYPIARIVVFKDTVLATKHPEYSFTQNGLVWKNNRKEAFVNPFLPEVWEYNLALAKKAAELGFQEIQFDYVRFPEGFEKRDEILSYSLGNYSKEKLEPRLLKEWEEQSLASRSPEPPSYSHGLARVAAVTDFVEYAVKELKPYGAKVSVDIFGYTATIPEALGIGQNFLKLSRHVDVISSMIYPSHWGFGYFGIPKPDKEPYRLVSEYIRAEQEILAQLENPPVSRPWIQDFTAPWLESGNYIKYGREEVEGQIRALYENGVYEFLLWNAGNVYTRNVNYNPVKLQEK